MQKDKIKLRKTIFKKVSEVYNKSIVVDEKNYSVFKDLD